MHPPKSPKRFFTFSPNSPPPPLPSTSPSESILYSPYHATSHTLSPAHHGQSQAQDRKHHTPSSSYSSTCSNLGYGATVVRTPQEALMGMKKSQSSSSAAGISPCGQNGHQHPSKESIGLTTAPLRTTLRLSQNRPSLGNVVGRDDDRDHERPLLRQQLSTADLAPRESSLMKDRRPSLSLRSRTESTIKSPPKGPLPPLPPTPFEATLLSLSIPSTMDLNHTLQPNGILVTLEFAFSVDSGHQNRPVNVPFDVLKRSPGGGGHLVEFVENCLMNEGVHLSTCSSLTRGLSEGSRYDDETKPEMTDGSSAEDSDLDSEYGLGALLRDEYLLSVAFTTDSSKENLQPVTPVSAPPKTGKKRAQTRNQYTQLEQSKFPTPSSPFTPPRVPKTTTATTTAMTMTGSILPTPTATSPPPPAKTHYHHPFNQNLCEAQSHGQNEIQIHSPHQTAPLTIVKRSPTSTSVQRQSRSLSRSQPQSHRAGLVRRIGGKMIEIRILLLRDAGPYHLIVHRLLTGAWRRHLDDDQKERVREEIKWSGLERCLSIDEGGDRMSSRRGNTGTTGKSLVIKGGQGYI